MLRGVDRVRFSFRDRCSVSQSLSRDCEGITPAVSAPIMLPKQWILFHPFLTPVKEPPPALFSAADVFEFQRGDPNGAISALQQASRAADPQIRAEALNRLARNQRKSGRWEEAMRVYAELRALGPINVGGLPAELLARDAMCALFEERGDVTRLKEEASAVYAAMCHLTTVSGRRKFSGWRPRPLWVLDLRRPRLVERGPSAHTSLVTAATGRNAHYQAGRAPEDRGSRPDRRGSRGGRGRTRTASAWARRKTGLSIEIRAVSDSSCDRIRQEPAGDRNGIPNKQC